MTDEEKANLAYDLLQAWWDQSGIQDILAVEPPEGWRWWRHYEGLIGRRFRAHLREIKHSGLAAKPATTALERFRRT